MHHEVSRVDSTAIPFARFDPRAGVSVSVFDLLEALHDVRVQCEPRADAQRRVLR